LRNRRSFLIASGLTALASTKSAGNRKRLTTRVLRVGSHRSRRAGCGTCSMRRQNRPLPDRGRERRVWAAPRCRQGKVQRCRHDSPGLSRSAREGHRCVAHRVPGPLARSHGSRCLAAGKDVYLEKPVTHTIEEGATLTRAVRSSKQILQCGMQQRSWTHFRDAVDMIQGGSLGRVVQVRTYWWQNYQRNWVPKPIDHRRSIGSFGSDPLRISHSARKNSNHWRWFWNFGGGAMTDLFTHWIDVVHWAMKSDQPREAQMLADKYFSISGIVPTPSRRHSATPGLMWCTRA
jgi:hypothetical protein